MDLAVVILLSLVYIANGFNPATRCLLFLDRCVIRCPTMMHAYQTRCNQDTMSQRTCDSPAVYSIGYTCGWSRCDCNGDKLLFEDEGVCVEEDECPVRKIKFRNSRKKNEPRHRKKLHLPRDEPEDPI